MTRTWAIVCGAVVDFPTKVRYAQRMKLPSLLLIAVLSLAGCAARPVHPGSPNQFDSSVYDSLIVTHNVIESTKTDLAANKFPASIAPNVVNALNRLVEAYNIADQEYKNYHALALAGTATPADQTALNSKVTDMTSAVTALSSAKGGM